MQYWKTVYITALHVNNTLFVYCVKGFSGKVIDAGRCRWPLTLSLGLYWNIPILIRCHWPAPLFFFLFNSWTTWMSRLRRSGESWTVVFRWQTRLPGWVRLCRNCCFNMLCYIAQMLLIWCRLCKHLSGSYHLQLNTRTHSHAPFGLLHFGTSSVVKSVWF